MSFYDYLRQDPMCLDANTGCFDFDATESLEGAVVMDISEVAEQLIERVDYDLCADAYRITIHTSPKGNELAKISWQEYLGYKILLTQYVGIIAPFDKCWFEFSLPTLGTVGRVDWGIGMTSVRTAEGSQISATLFNRHTAQNVSFRHSTTEITSDEEGRLLSITDSAKGDTLEIPLVVLLVSLMMLNHGCLKSTLREPPPKSRQQRRFEARHPDRATPPFVQYYTLEIDLTKTQAGESHPTKKGGWIQAWHPVRGFQRHLKSGKVVPVKAHGRGNPFKGVILHAYKLKTNTRTAKPGNEE